MEKRQKIKSYTEGIVTILSVLLFLLREVGMFDDRMLVWMTVIDFPLMNKLNHIFM